MKGIDIVYHADNNTMELKDAPDDLLIGTDGDDYATYLRFQIIDDEGILDGFSPYVLFEVESRPMIELDESYTLNLTQDLLNKARYGNLPFMLVFKGKESTIEIRSVNSLTLGIAHSIDADREVEDDTPDSELAIKYVEITYHAESRLMELTDMPDDQFVGTDGDDYATYLRFIMDDPDGLLTGYGARVEFDVSIKDDNGDVYKPFIVIDESMSVPLIQRILSNVKYGAIPIQLAFKRTDSEGRSSQFYSLNKLRLSISDSIHAIEDIDVDDHIDFNSAINNVVYNPKTATFSFRQIDGGMIAIQLSDLSEEHFEVDTYANLITLDEAESGDTATVTDTGVWYKLYGDYSVIGNWKKMPGGSTLNGSDTSFPVFYAPEQSGTAGQYLESLGINQSPVWTSKASSVNDDTTLPTGSAVTSYVKSKAPKLYTKSRNDPFYSSSNELLNITNANHQDYAYVKGTDNGNAYVDLYVADRDGNVITWNKKARFYNVSLSQVQWNAVDSGITSTKVGEYDSHISNMQNPHSVTKEQLGLENVDNTSDVDKPISTATQEALDDKADKTTVSLLRTEFDEEVRVRAEEDTNIKADLDTKADKVETQNALNDKANKSDVETALDTKADKLATEQALDSKADKSIMETALSLKADKSDVEMALDTKADKTVVSSLSNTLTKEIQDRQDGDNTNATAISTHATNKSNPHGVTKAQVGLGNVDNTSDADKPISTATQNALNLKADKSEISSLYRPKGSVATVNDLPSNAQIGDVYDVQSTGMNYVWTGSRWDELGAIIDLSPYYTKTEVDGALSGKVSKSGDTMTGDLVVNNAFIRLTKSYPRLYFKDTTGVIGTTNGGDSRIVFQDKNGAEIGNINNQIGKLDEIDGATYTHIQAVSKKSDGTLVYGSIAVRSLPNGTTYGLAPTPSNKADNSTKIATTSWTAQSNFLVHTTGNETIAGVKSFTGGWRVVNATTMEIINQGIPKDAYPTATSQRFINFKDAGDIARSGLYGGSRTNDNHIGLRVYGSSNFSGIELSYNPNDDSYKAVAPTTSSSATSNEIATANWTLSKFVALNGSQTITGEKSFSSTPNMPAIELRSNTPFIDFHYNNTAIDYTNRIISDADGQLKFINKTADGSKSFNVTMSTVNQAMYLPVSTPSASTGNEVVTANWSIGKFVQKSGDTMTGELIANGGVRANFVRKLQTDGQNVSYLMLEEGETSNTISLNARKSTGETTAVYPSLKLYANSDATYYATLTSNYIGYNDNSDKILTIKMANSLPSLVHTTGNETVAGVKSYTSDCSFIRSADANALPTAYENRGSIYFRDNNGVNRGVIRCDADTTYTRTYISAERYINGTHTVGRLDLRIKSDGSVVSYAPQTPTGAVGTEIATANWSIGKFVKKSGDTMTGVLELKESTNVTISIEKGQAGAGKYRDFTFYDKGDANGENRIRRGNIRCEVGNVQTALHLRAYKFDGSAGASLTVIQPETGDACALAPSWSVGTNDNSDKVLTIKMANSMPSLCHSTGNETWSGSKSFTSNVNLIKAYEGQFLIQATSVTRGTIPSSDLSPGRFRVTDGANATFGEVYTSLGSDGSSSTTLCAVKNQTSRADANIVVGWTADGTQFATAPTTSSTATSNEIVTANWSLGKFVALSGNQTIAGQKTFTSGIYHKGSNPVIHQNSTLINKGTKPSASNISGIRYGDTDGNILGGFRYVLRPNGNGEVYSEIQNFDGSATAMLKAIATADGQTYAEAPTPSSTSDNSTKIPTTAWINSADIICRTVGNQTIAGTKTYTDNVYLSKSGSPLFLVKHTGIELGVTGNDGGRYGLEIMDLKGTIIGQFQTKYDSSLNNKSYIGVKGSNGKWSLLELFYNNDGTTYAKAPTTPSTATSNEIATANWCNGKFVKKTGDTMTGDLVRKSTQYENNDFVQTRHVLGEYEFQDKNGVFSGYLRRVGSTATQYTQMGCVAKINDATVSSTLEAHILPDGTAYCNAISWNVGTNDNSDKILTIKMANSLPSLVHSYGNETIDGEKVFSSPVKDPQNDLIYFVTPNSGTASAPYYCVAESTANNLGNYNRVAFVLNVAVHRYSDTYEYAKIRVNTNTSANNSLSSVRLFMLEQNAPFQSTDPTSWTVTYNTVEDKIQLWVKVTNDQFSTYISVDSSVNRYGRDSKWKLISPSGGSATLPSVDEGWIHVPCEDRSKNKFVAIDGSNSMTGSLTLNLKDPRLDVVNTLYTKGTAPSGTRYWVTGRMHDSNISPVMSIEGTVLADERRVYQFATISNSNAWSYPVKIVANSDNSGAYMVCPTPASKSDNSTRVATTSWISTADCIVHKTGNENVSGQKNFKDILKREISDNSAGLVMNHTKASGSTSTYYNDILWRDNSIVRAYVRCNLMPDGESIQLVPRNAEGGYGGEPLTVKWTSTNGMEVHIPYAPENSNGVNAVNTSWANNHFVKKTNGKVTESIAFTGQVGNTQTEAGVYLGMDTNASAPNANIAIVSANTASYIDMSAPNEDYGFRIIKWNGVSDSLAQLCYSDASITIPRANGTMALRSDIPTITASTTDIGEGSALATGTLYLVYE